VFPLLLAIGDLSPERFAKMRDRAWSKIWQAEKRVVRSLAHLADRFHSRGIERLPDVIVGNSIRLASEVESGDVLG